MLAGKGTTKWIEANITSVRSHGQINGRIVVGRDISERKATQAEKDNAAGRLSQQQAVLLELAKSPFVDLQTAIHQLTESTATTLGIERVSVWFFNEERTELVCRDLFQLGLGKHEAGQMLSVDLYPRYFDALKQSRFIAAHDAVTDPRTSEFAAGYLDVYGISSMMDAPIRHIGKTVGVVCHEHTGAPRDWAVDEQSFAGSIADFVSLAIETAEVQRAESELKALNEQLERRVGERTAALEFMNEKLAREIRMRRQTEDSLAQEKAFTSHIVETAPTLICGVAPDGTCTYLNQAVTNVTGYQEEEVLGQNWWRLFYLGEAYEQVEKLFEDFEKQGFTVHNYEMDLTTKNGTKRTISWNSVNRFDSQGTVIEVIGIGADITEHQQAEAALRSSEERYRLLSQELEERVEARTVELSEVIQELESFSYSVSHDMRAPLRAIDGFSLAILEDSVLQLNPSCHRYLTLIRQQAKNMGNLIDDLLTFSRLGRQALKATELDMYTLTQTVFQELIKFEPGRNVRLNLSPDLPRGYGDPTLVQQLLVNLLSNALKFSRPRTPAVIEVEGKVDRSHCLYIIRDNGVGFNMQYSKKLFGVFDRLHSMEEFEGTGVGLAIVQRVIKRHGGQVWGESVLNEGATFSFTLPKKGTVV
ncbi:MAG: PAS domain S-box protein [Nitrospirae bacterium]|nr:PAS domain S-box protein [Nitrospirota bacterium]